MVIIITEPIIILFSFLHCFLTFTNIWRKVPFTSHNFTGWLNQRIQRIVLCRWQNKGNWFHSIWCIVDSFWWCVNLWVGGVVTVWGFFPIINGFTFGVFYPFLLLFCFQGTLHWTSQQHGFLTCSHSALCQGVLIRAARAHIVYIQTTYHCPTILNSLLLTLEVDS